jgi:ATP-dependent RNA helicase DeaD
MPNYSEMGLNKELFKAISEMGFEKPTPIQEKTIPAIANNNSDIIALAQTGTGKTAGFGLPVLNQIDLKNRQTQALILCPTRELCLQISKDIQMYSKYMHGISTVAVYGGTSIVPQMKDLQKSAQIVVGTPGRTLDLIKRKVLKPNNIKWMILDEADEMLNMGFKEELDSILANTPNGKQTLLFSATMPNGVRSIANKYMNNIEEIAVGGRNTGADNVTHHYYVVKASDKYTALRRLIDINSNLFGIVFCRTRRETKEISEKLMQDGYSADALHGDLSQSQRDHVMQRFRLKHLQLLIATDVAARGLDVNDLTHVINYNLPDDPEIYIHRSGRTGRAGKFGISIAILHSRETGKLKQIEKLTKKEFVLKKVPGGHEICEKRLFSLVETLKDVKIDEAQIESFLPAVFNKLIDIEREELIKRFVSIEFNRFLEYYKNADDINQSNKRERESHSKGAKKGYSRFFINLGTKHNINTARLIGILNDFTGSRDIAIGKIDILRKFSFFEVEHGYESKILGSFTGQEVEGVEVDVQLSKPETPKKDNKRGGGSNRRNNTGSYNKKDYNRSGSRDRKKNSKRRY